MQDSIQSETVLRTVLARLLICGDNVYKKVEVLSGGERIKVSFAKLMLSKANILLLDEPTNYLDITSIKALQVVECSYILYYFIMDICIINTKIHNRLPVLFKSHCFCNVLYL